MEGTMAVVTPWAANFEPGGWMFCKGQTMSIAANSALYALIGTTYGGDGQQTFNLPDMQSRVAIGTGQGPGLHNYVLGQKGGTETNTITTSQMAAHNHAFNVNVQMPANNSGSSTSNPVGAYPAVGSTNLYNSGASGGVFTGNFATSSQVTVAGAGIPVNNIKPVLCVNYIICVEGIFPSRN